jgi:hypothetical protein
MLQSIVFPLFVLMEMVHSELNQGAIDVIAMVTPQASAPCYNKIGLPLQA